MKTSTASWLCLSILALSSSALADLSPIQISVLDDADREIEHLEATVAQVPVIEGLLYDRNFLDSGRFEGLVTFSNFGRAAAFDEYLKTLPAGSGYAREDYARYIAKKGFTVAVSFSAEWQKADLAQHYLVRSIYEAQKSGKTVSLAFRKSESRPVGVLSAAKVRPLFEAADPRGQSDIRYAVIQHLVDPRYHSLPIEYTDVIAPHKTWNPTIRFGQEPAVKLNDWVAATLKNPPKL